MYLPGVVLIPHMGSATFERRQAMAEKGIADNWGVIDQVVEGWV